MPRPVSWGIIGPGKIATSFASDLSLLPDARLKAVASRDTERSRGFAARFGAEKAYGSYGELFADPDVEVVYIASPHNLHMEHTLQALEAGKHVLCEKPLGISGREVDQMVRAAASRDRFLMEALWTRFNPNVQAVYELVCQGDLGPLSYVRADFAFPALDRDPGSRLLNPGLGGGSLLDIGIYPVFLAYLMLGEPRDIRVAAHYHPTGVEKQIGMIFEYPDALAMLYSGFTSRSEMKAELSCAEGSVYLNPRWHEAQSYEIHRGEEVEVVENPLKGEGYVHEIEEVHRCLRAGLVQSERWSWSDSRALHGLLDRVRKQAGIVFPGES